ncbi:MAG: uncharacterized protein JWN40_2410 [Phycisphaerales bacterium]|nr:uncharacterized protein [Phycisphaerales bacterium]
MTKTTPSGLTCFVMQPFDKGKFDKRYADVFEPAIKAAALQPYRVDRDASVNIPIDEIQRGIEQASVCFAEITTDNPNVWFELGFAIGVRKPVCLVCSSERTTSFPFDVRHRSIVTYEVGSSSDFDKLKADIKTRLDAILKTERSLTTLANNPPTKSAQGLKPYELAAIAIIAADSQATWQLRNAMEQAGFNDLATKIAIERLKKRSMILEVPGEDDRGESFSAVELTPEGREWLLENEDLFELRTPKQQSYDLPF